MKLFPTIKEGEPLPSKWLGIWRFKGEERTHLCAPIGLNWLLAVGYLGYLCASKPWFMYACARADDYARLQILDRNLYQLRHKHAELKIAYQAEQTRRIALERMLGSTIQEGLHENPYIRRSDV
jgi:hypothetical protein